MNGRYHFTWVRFPNIYLQILPQTVGVWLPIKDLPRGNSSACTPSCPPTLLYTPSCPPTLLCRVVVMFWCYVPLLYVLLCRRGASCHAVRFVPSLCHHSSHSPTPLTHSPHTAYSLAPLTHSPHSSTAPTHSSLAVFLVFVYYCVVHTHTHTHTTFI